MKKNTEKSIRPAIFLCLFFLPLSLAYAEGEGKFLKWQQVEGASYYSVEIRKGDRIVRNIETEDSFIQLDLLPGEYSYKISVYNKFKKNIGESGWRVLTIEEKLNPFIRKFEPLALYYYGEPFTLKITAYNTDEKSVFSIRNNDTVYTGKILFSEESVYSVEFGTGNDIIPGNYSLMVENSAGGTDSAVDNLALKVPLKPVVKKLDNTLKSGLVHGNISLEGSGFEPGVSIEFRKNGSAVKPLAVEFISEERVVVILDLKTAEAGYYAVFAENPSGMSGTYERVLEVTEKTTLMGAASDTDWPGVKKDLFTIHGGLSYGYLLNNFSDYHNYNYWGITARLQFDFRNKFFDSYQWLAPFGGELVFDHYPKDLSFTEIGVNIYFKSRFPSMFNFILRGGAGFSFFENTDNSPDNGHYIQGTAGVVMKLFDSVYLDFSTGPKIWSVSSDYYDYIISSATAGLSF